jgi:hypothetical protein
VIPILREYLKDGILDPNEDLDEHTAAEIHAAADRDAQIGLLSENLMLYIKKFGDENKAGKLINNEYITCFAETLRAEFGY